MRVLLFAGQDWNRFGRQACVLAAMFPLSLAAGSASAVTFTVTNTNDSGAGSLREAITLASSAGVPSTVQFDAGVTSITLATALPAITGTVIVDGSLNHTAGTQVEVFGNSLVGDGLDIASDNCEVYGLYLHGFTGNGISVSGGFALIGAAGKGNVLSGNTAKGLTVSGPSAQVFANIIGLQPDGSTVLANGGDGLGLTSFATGTVVGTTSAADRNIISGNGAYGINCNAANTAITGNYVGTDSTGLVDKGNVNTGVVIFGASVTVRGNVISGNDFDGVYCNADGVHFFGNIIGLAADANTVVANTRMGIFTDTGGTHMVIGSSSASDRNVVSGNTGFGLYLTGTNPTIQGNFVGTDSAGTQARGNGGGLYAENLTTGSMTIGGPNAGEGNVFSGNVQYGMHIANIADTLIQRNIIGMDVTGTAPLGNGWTGIFDNVTSTNNRIFDNVISCNGTAPVADRYGIRLAQGTTGTLIRGNKIGTDINGTPGFGNVRDGILSVDNVIIGGTGPGEGNLIMSNGRRGIELGMNAPGTTVIGNVISGNASYGINITGPEAATIQGNLIGLTAAGTTAFANGESGIAMAGTGAHLIGGTTVAQRNVISGNNLDGIANGGTSGTTIRGNYIGTDVTGTVAIGNQRHGVSFTGTGDVNAVLAGNTIAHSLLDNVQIGAATTGVEIDQNSIDGDCRFPISFNGALASNDALDPDTGSNNQQNYPTINPVTPAQVAITGNIDTTAATLVTIHLYSNAAAHSSAFGPGETWLGSTTVTTDGSGNAAWSINAGPFPIGRVLSAIAVVPNGDSSHFSASVTVSVNSGVQDWRALEE